MAWRSSSQQIRQFRLPFPRAITSTPCIRDSPAPRRAPPHNFAKKGPTHAHTRTAAMAMNATLHDRTYPPLRAPVPGPICSLADNQIGPVGASALGEALKVRLTLTDLQCVIVGDLP